MSFAPRLLAGASLALLCLTASATVTTYSSADAFLAHVQSGSYTESFDGLPANPPSAFSGNGYGYTVTAPGGMYGGDDHLTTNQPYEMMTISFTGNPVTAVGGNFFAVELSGPATLSTITVTLSDSTTVTFNSTSLADSYFGFASDGSAITSLTISAADVPNIGLYPALDNLTVGVVTQVPEPASLALFSLGAAALLIFRRAR